MSRRLIGLLLFCALAVVTPHAQVASKPAAPATAAAASRITTPKEEFGHDFGDDYFLANYQQISAYWKKLAKQSNRIVLEDIGETAEGRRQLMAIVTSPENHKKLARYKQISSMLAHARDANGAVLTDAAARALAREGKAIDRPGGWLVERRRQIRVASTSRARRTLPRCRQPTQDLSV